MKKIKFVLIAIASLTLILVMVALVRNSLVSHDFKRLDGLPPKGVDMQIGDIHYEQTDENASKEWELDAKSAQYFKGENRVKLHSIKLTFFSGGGKVYKLTADDGELYTDSKDVNLSGNVIVATEEGYHVQADSFKYNAEERKIFTNDRVHLNTKELDMTGKGMVIDLKKEKLYILGEVKALEKK